MNEGQREKIYVDLGGGVKWGTFLGIILWQPHTSTCWENYQYAMSEMSKTTNYLEKCSVDAVVRSAMMEGTGTLEAQLEATKAKSAEVRANRSQLKHIEDLSAAMEERLILDNRYTEHSTVGLAQQWDQLDQLGMRMQHNLEQQLQAL